LTDRPRRAAPGRAARRRSARIRGRKAPPRAPPRFSATIEVRKEGSTAGTSDIYYYDGGGRRFRSRAEVARALGLAPLSGGPGQRTKAKDAAPARATEASRQRARRLEAKLEKALDRHARRAGASRGGGGGDDAALDPAAAPDLAALGRTAGGAGGAPAAGAGDVSHVLATWHFLATFANELGLGLSHGAVYDDEIAGDDGGAGADAARRAAARKDRAVLRAGPTELARRVRRGAPPSAAPPGAPADPDDDDGFLRRAHCALLRLLLADPAAGAWWPGAGAADDRRGPAAAAARPSEAAARRPRAAAARVALDAGAVLARDADEPDAVTTRWLEALEGIRHLKTNSGNPIRDGVLVGGGATAAPPPAAPPARAPSAAPPAGGARDHDERGRGAVPAAVPRVVALQRRGDDEARRATGPRPRARAPARAGKGCEIPNFSKAPISAGFHSFRLIFGRAIIPLSALEACMLFLERARARNTHVESTLNHPFPAQAPARAPRR